MRVSVLLKFGIAINSGFNYELNAAEYSRDELLEVGIHKSLDDLGLRRNFGNFGESLE